MNSRIAMSLLLFVTTSTQLGGMSALAAAGGDKGNGGDMCEDRIKVIRDDIQSWIGKGGPSHLKFPANITLDQYNVGMLIQIPKASVSCVDSAVTIGNAEKTCINSIDASGDSRIVCNARRFMGTSESDQYVLVHHEYAGLAGIEISKGEDSDYQVSNQISGYLENQVIKKLAVKPSHSAVSSLPSNVRLSGIDSVLEPALKYSCLEKIEQEHCSSNDDSHEGIAEVSASCDVWTSFAYNLPDGSRSSIRYRLEVSTSVGSNGLDILGSVFTMGLAQIITSPAKQAVALSRAKNGLPVLMSKLSDTLESSEIGLCSNFVNYSSNALPTSGMTIHRPDNSGLCRVTSHSSVYNSPSQSSSRLSTYWEGTLLYDTGVRMNDFAKVQVLVPRNGVDTYPPSALGWIYVGFTDCTAN